MTPLSRLKPGSPGVPDNRSTWGAPSGTQQGRACIKSDMPRLNADQKGVANVAGSISSANGVKPSVPQLVKAPWHQLINKERLHLGRGVMYINTQDAGLVCSRISCAFPQIATYALHRPTYAIPRQSCLRITQNECKRGTKEVRFV
jgi:hypothetical protein